MFLMFYTMHLCGIGVGFQSSADSQTCSLPIPNSTEARWDEAVPPARGSILGDTAAFHSSVSWQQPEAVDPRERAFSVTPALAPGTALPAPLPSLAAGTPIGLVWGDCGLPFARSRTLIPFESGHLLPEAAHPTRCRFSATVGCSISPGKSLRQCAWAWVRTLGRGHSLPGSWPVPRPALPRERGNGVKPPKSANNKRWLK